MPNNNRWWRGKRLFDVGYFPSSCVELIREGSTVLNNPDDLIRVIKQHHTGSLRLRQKQSKSIANNENENPLANLLKCRQLRDDEKLASIQRLTIEKEQLESNNSESGNYSTSGGSRNQRKDDDETNTDKKPLIECQTNSNSMNIKQHSTPNTTRILRSISPFNTQQTDHHTVMNNSAQHSIVNRSLTPGISSQSMTVFQRRNRISSTLPKSLNAASATNNGIKSSLCVNLFNNPNSIDTPDKVHSSNRCQLLNANCSIDSTIANCPNNLSSQTSSPQSQLMGNNKRSNKLSNFLRSIINRNNTTSDVTTTSQFDKRGTLKRQDKSNVLINLRRNKKILIKNTVFGCELNEYLNRTGRRIPLVLESCCSFLEENGIIHGVYRLSGVNSNIQKLIKCFNDDESPDFSDDIFLQDVHCVSSLLKLYFKELPNPLLTFELYDKFVKAIQPSYDPNGLPSTSAQDELPESKKLSNLIKVLQTLPLNHYVALEYLVKHLNRIASHSEQTGMTIKNLAIVWSPNLLRSKELETQGGIGALQCIAIQAVLTEYLIRYAKKLFVEESRPFNYFEDQDDEFNGSFVSNPNNTYNLSDSLNSSSIKDKRNTDDRSNQFDRTVHSKNRTIKQEEADCSIETDETNSDKFNCMESKFTIIQDNGLLDLPVARRFFQQKCNSSENENQTLDQLVNSKLKDDTNDLFAGPCPSFVGSKKFPVKTDEESGIREENSEITFGVLGKFDSTRGRKRFGNLDLVDEELDESIDLSGEKQNTSVRKRRSLFESECIDEDCENAINKFVAIDRFKYKGFDEQSDDECKSNNSLKLLSNDKTEQTDEPLQRYHTILNPKHFYKNKISSTKENSSTLNSNLIRRTPNKWKSNIFGRLPESNHINLN